MIISNKNVVTVLLEDKISVLIYVLEKDDCTDLCVRKVARCEPGPDFNA